MNSKIQAAADDSYWEQNFAPFCDEYYKRLVKRFGQIETVVVKWPRESMLGDFSDFDGRIIASDRIDLATWAAVDELIGHIHMEMVDTHPQWMRLLEHPPGIGITWQELDNEILYQPETHHWDHAMGKKTKFQALRRRLENRPWGQRDEYYYLKRFFYYYSPYIHGIDPPTNMGALADRYAVHSHVLHYCIPALQAGLSVLYRKPVRCKMETIKLCSQLWPGDTLFEEFLEKIHCGYKCPEVHDPQKMKELEEACWLRLQRILALLPNVVSIIDMQDRAGFEIWKERLNDYQEDPILTIFNGVRFARIRKGRYWFYLNAPKHFAADWLIANEFIWLRNFFTKSVFQCYGRLKCHLDNASLDEIIDAARAGVIDADAEKSVRRVFDLSWDMYVKGDERRMLTEVMDVFGDYLCILELLLEDAMCIARGSSRVYPETEQG